MTTDDRFASSRARTLAAELELDPATLKGTGKDGRITVADVRRTAESVEADGTGPPRGLGEAGLALWQAILADLGDDFELDHRELSILALAARQADHLALLEARVAEDGPMILGSAGQLIVHPGIAESRQARLTINRLLGAVELPAGDDRPMTDASKRAQHAASVRWRLQHEKEGRRNGPTR